MDSFLRLKNSKAVHWDCIMLSATWSPRILPKRSPPLTSFLTNFPRIVSLPCIAVLILWAESRWAGQFDFSSSASFVYRVWVQFSWWVYKVQPVDQGMEGPRITSQSVVLRQVRKSEIEREREKRECLKQKFRSLTKQRDQITRNKPCIFPLFQELVCWALGRTDY